MKNLNRSHREQQWAFVQGRFAKCSAKMAGRSARVLALAGCLLAVVCSTGCKSDDIAAWTTPIPFDLKRPIPWQTAKEKREAQPVRIVAMWDDTIQYQAGNTPKRGFGGRIFFYGQKEEPVEVEGRVVVYAFDENGRDVTDSRPDKKYIFPAELLKEHMSETETGPSYSFWLPWDAVGGVEKDISLIAKLESTSGPVITSAQTRLKLPGTQPWDQQLAGKTSGRAGKSGNQPQGINRGASAGASRATGHALTQNHSPMGGVSRDVAPVQPASYQKHHAAQQATASRASVSRDGSVVPTSGQAEEPRQQMKTTTIALPSQFGRARPNAVAYQKSSRSFDSRFTQNVESNGSRGEAIPATARKAAVAESTAQPSTGFRLGRSRAVGQPIPRLESGRSQ